MTGLLHAVRAFLYLGFVEALSYPLMMVDRLVNLVAIVTLLFLGANMVPAGNSAQFDVGPDYFVFGIIGLAVLQLFNASLAAFKAKLRNYQLNGVLEACVMTRTSLWQILVATPAYDLLTALGRAVLLVVIGLVVSGTGVPFFGAVGALSVLVLGVSSFVCLGLISACATLVLKQGEPITRAISLSTLLFGGAFYPRELLPPWLEALAGLLPIAPTLDAVRGLLYGSAVPGSVGASVLLLGAMTAALVPITAAVFVASVRHVLRDGSLAHY